MDGFLLLNKEKGITSNQLVQTVKKSLSIKKVGHLGTLDPMATGLMVLATNRATKFSNFFLESDKAYKATIKLGSKTDTDDAMGNVIKTYDKPLPDSEKVVKVINSLIGQSKQIPPFFSALKHKGKPLYKYARDGEFISKPAREINIYSINNIKMRSDECSFYIHCSKGTYIRSIARDIGEELGCGAHLKKLERVSQGRFDIKQSHLVENINFNNLISIEEAFMDLYEIKLEQNQSKVFLNGGKLSNFKLQENNYRIYDDLSNFLGLGFIVNETLSLKRLV